MKVGTLAYATESGLGVLAKAFYDHGVITDVLRVRHPHYVNHFAWYPGSTEIDYKRMDALGRTNSPDRMVAMEFCRGLDAVLFFETPFDWTLIDYCRSVGVKTAMVPMHEYMPEHWPARPDLIINPSDLEQHLYPTGKRINVPVDAELLDRGRGLDDWGKDVWPGFPREVKTFVHNAGHGGVYGRNGTDVLLAAIPYVESPIKLIVRAQRFGPRLSTRNLRDKRIDFRQGDVPFDQLYAEGEAFVFPERFNGLSLPLQEAYASGMLVIATDRFPMNTWLPKEPLVPGLSVEEARVSSFHQPFVETKVSAQAVARTIDAWYGKDYTEYAQRGRAWAKSNSWDILGPTYVRTLGALCRS